jgi:putative ABC transport system permease protein
MARPPKIPLALKILLHTPGRLAVSLAGIMLAVVLMFSQTGFRNAMFDSQANIIRLLDGDLFIISKAKHIIYDPDSFASRRIYQAKAVPGVREVHPLYIESAASIWRNPVDRKLRPIRVLAFDPSHPPFRFPEVTACAEQLRMPDTVMFDTESRDYYGKPQAGTQTELAGREVTVVGTFQLGTDFFTDGNVIMSDRNFEKFFPDRFSRKPHLDKVAIGLVKVNPGSSIKEVKVVQQALRTALPYDVDIFTQDQLASKETEYWEDNTAIGKIFLLGMIVAITVGIIICYQILYTNVNNYLPQFATLKAIGFTGLYLVGVVLQQALFLSVLGFLPALAASQVLFWYVSDMTGLLMFLTRDRIARVLGWTVAMCLVSGLIAVRRILTTDPAEVFK